LNAKDLEALGAERLAELLIEVCDGNAAVRRRIRLDRGYSLTSSELCRSRRCPSAKLLLELASWATLDHVGPGVPLSNAASHLPVQ